MPLALLLVSVHVIKFVLRCGDKLDLTGEGRARAVTAGHKNNTSRVASRQEVIT